MKVELFGKLQRKRKVGEEGGISFSLFFFSYSFEKLLLGERRGSLMRHGFFFFFGQVFFFEGY